APAEHARELAQRARRRRIADNGKRQRRQLGLDQDLDRALRGAATLDPLAPHAAIRERREREAHDLGLRAGAADPAVQLAVSRDERAVAHACRGGSLDADDSRERKRRPLGSQTAGLDERVHSARPTSFSACQTLSGVSGMSMLRTPACASASITALTYAAGEPTVADSPTPFAPIGWGGDGVTGWPSSNAGVSHEPGSR